MNECIGGCASLDRDTWSNIETSAVPIIITTLVQHPPADLTILRSGTDIGGPRKASCSSSFFLCAVLVSISLLVVVSLLCHSIVALFSLGAHLIHCPPFAGAPGTAGNLQLRCRDRELCLLEYCLYWNIARRTLDEGHTRLVRFRSGGISRPSADLYGLRPTAVIGLLTK